MRTVDYVKLIIGLKWKLIFRSYKSDNSSLIGIIVFVVIFAPMVLMVAGMSCLGFLKFEWHLSEHLLRAIFIGIYFLWLVAPIIGLILNESYDFTKLFVFPVSAQQILMGSTIASLVDIPVLFLLPELAAVLIGFTHNIFSFLFISVILAVFLFHLVAIGQIIIFINTGLTRNRKWRDMLSVLIPLLGMCFYICIQLISRADKIIDYKKIINSSAWDLINYLPSGLVARSIAAVSRGEYLTSLEFLVVFSLLTLGIIRLAGFIFYRISDGELIIFSGKKTQEKSNIQSMDKSVVTTKTNIIGSKFPPVVDAVINKDLKYMSREPYFKTILISFIYASACIFFAVVFPISRHGISTGFSASPVMLWLLIPFLTWIEVSVPCNIFGIEGNAAATLFLFPSSRRQIFVAKNLVHFIFLTLFNIVFIGLICILFKSMTYYPKLLLFAILGTVISISIGNLVSVKFPIRMVMKGWRMQPQSVGKNFSYGFVTLFVTMIAFGLLLPIAAALIVPSYWISNIWLLLTIPFAIVYTAACYLVSLHISENLLLSREIEIVEKLCKDV